jgi:hypothetical protein
MHELLHCRFMREGDPVRLRALAKDCLEQANKARTAVDQDAWLQLAEDFIKLATTLEQSPRARLWLSGRRRTPHFAFSGGPGGGNP